ncbi:hypothetical protein D5S18_27170 [Nocardia panacis]|uniref:Uncharacterized protein n=1 Tax=Nocardia panacis TaxID=2340916 RepID=A0A3A4K856_9NOCA|nr:hypothetical protein [Nocardia panacis]RJO70867.1 hypothetical protein D5S18_27170 [Nocardia panacis]
MTDFVDRLLGRGRIAGIRPLIPTLFEPLSARGGDMELPMGQFTDTGHDSAEVGVDPARPDQRAESLRVQSGSPVSQAVHLAVSGLPGLSAPGRPRPARSGLPGSASAVSVPTTTNSSESNTIEVSSAMYTVESVVEAVEFARTLVERTSSAQTIVEHAPVLDSARTTAPRSADPTPPGPISRRARAARGAGVEPEVRISIGRVEIRSAASGSEPTRRAEAPKRPQVSLEDYLRERDARGRG